MSEATAVAMSVTEMSLEDLKAAYISAKADVEFAAESLAESKSVLEAKIAELESQFSVENAEAIGLLTGRQSAADSYEAELRNRAIAHYESTGQKSLDANLGVRVTTKYIYETADAVAWAESNAPVMIVKSVDKKAFEALPTLTELDFVSVEAKTSAVIKGL